MEKFIKSASCAKQVYYGDLGLKQKKKIKSFELAIIFKEMIEEQGIKALTSFTKSKLRKLIEEKIKEKEVTFDLPSEKEIEVNIMVQQFHDILGGLMKLGFKIVSAPETIKTVFHGKKVTVRVDGVLEHEPTGERVILILKNGTNPFAASRTARGSITGDLMSYGTMVAYNQYHGTDYGLARVYLMPKCIDKALVNNHMFDFDNLVNFEPFVRDLIDGCGKDKNTYNSKSKDISILQWSDYTRAKDAIDDEFRKIGLIDTTCSAVGPTDPSACSECRFANICNAEDPFSGKFEKKTVVEKAKSDAVFTSEQEAVINFKRGIALVEATAGSGKTTTLVNRIIKLIKDGADASKILVTTFTEKGVTEIKEKLNYWAERNDLGEQVKEVTIATFNGFSNRIVIENYEDFLYDKPPVVLSELDSIEIFKEALNEVGTFHGLNYRNPMLDMYRAKGAVIQLRELIFKMRELGFKTKEDLDDLLVELDKKDCDFTQEGSMMQDAGFKKVSVEDFDKLEMLCLILDRKLQEKSALLYCDQVPLAIEGIRGIERVKNKNSFDHIIVDEFQDTSLEQMNLIMLLNMNAISLMACGDPAQAIFAFRGVGPQNFYDWEKYFPQSKKFYLSTNFRSKIDIIEYAYREIRGLSNVYGNKEGGEVIVEQLDEDYPIRIADMIEEQIKKGERPSDIAILGPSRRNLLKISKILQTRGIPYSIQFGESLIEGAGFNGTIALLDCILGEERDDIAFLSWIKVKEPELLHNAELGLVLNREYMIVQEAVKDLTDSEKFDYFFEQLKSAKSGQDSIPVIIEQLIKNDLNSPLDVKNYLYSLKKYAVQDLLVNKIEVDAVNISTIHAAKGREWKNVYHINNDSEDNIQYEKARVRYVAITRAMDRYVVFEKIPSNIFEL